MRRFLNVDMDSLMRSAQLLGRKVSPLSVLTPSIMIFLGFLLMLYSAMRICAVWWVLLRCGFRLEYRPLGGRSRRDTREWLTSYHRSTVCATSFVRVCLSLAGGSIQLIQYHLLCLFAFSVNVIEVSMRTLWKQ